MKDLFETILIVTKITAALLATAFFIIIVFRPDLVALQIQKISHELEEVEDTVEYSVIFLKFTKTGEAAKDIGPVQDKLDTANSTIRGLSCKLNPNADDVCSAEDHAAADSVLDNLTREKALKVGSTDKISVNQAWIVLAGSTETIEAAEQINTAIARNVGNTDVILAAGRYRSVAVFSSSSEAKSALEKINQTLSRKDAYVRLLVAWCDDHFRSSDRFLSCDRTKQLK